MYTYEIYNIYAGYLDPRFLTFFKSVLLQYEVFPVRLAGCLAVCLVQLAKMLSPNLISVTARLAGPQMAYTQSHIWADLGREVLKSKYPM